MQTELSLLYVIHRFIPFSRFGAELYTYYLAREFANAGANVRLFSSRPDMREVEQRQFENLPCTIVPQTWRPGTESLDQTSADIEQEFTSVLKSHRPQIVHINHLIHLSTNLPRLAKEHGCSVVFTLHDYWLACPKVKLLDWWGRRCETATAWKCASCVRSRYSRLTWTSLRRQTHGLTARLRQGVKECYFQLLERPAGWLRIRARRHQMAELIPYVDCFLAPSSFLRDQLVQWGVPRERIRQCDYGTAQLPYVLPATHDGRRRSRFAFLGGNNYEKGLHVLLTAFRGFRDGELVVYGERSPEIQMEFSDVFAQENVTHAGPIDDAEKAIVLPQFDALIVPSIWFENSPLVIHEAFAARVPVICSGIGGMAELVTNGLDGLHFEVGDAKSLRDVLARCVRERELLGRLRRGIQAPKPMEEHVRNEILPLYLELLNRNSFPQTRGAPVCESQAKALEATSRPC